MKQDRVLGAKSATATEVILATDSTDPSGVGHHMITLAAHLGPDWAPTLAFAAGPMATKFKFRSRSLGLEAHIIAPDGWARLFAGTPGLLHIHAGIGWEGQDLAAMGKEIGRAHV